jgi:chaperone required for assembly of F1-ATPase
MSARFYKQAAVAEAKGGFIVTLDGRSLRTPAKAPLVAPKRALAQLAADEWSAQGETLKPETMPITRLINVAIDFTPGARAELAATIGKFGQTDLLCHRADQPPSLAERQAKAWDGLLAWADTHLGASLIAAPGIFAHRQPEGALAALASRAAALDVFRLTGLAHAAGLAGSAVLAFAIAEGKLSPEAAFLAAALDDLYQIETWGEDAEARERLNNQRAEYEALARFFLALTADE